jgi:hypothetical protein
MLGWHIVIFRTNAKTHLVYDASTDETRLASWSTGMNGLAWLDHLAKANKISDLGGNGYPYRYSAKASEILPTISSALSSCNKPITIGNNYAISARDISTLKVDELKISACSLDDQLLIEAWDQS